MRAAPHLHSDLIRIAWFILEVAAAFDTTERDLVNELENRISKRLRIEERADFHLEHFEFVSLDALGQDEGRRFTAVSPT